MARGSIQRGRGRWELRVDAGVDAATGRQRDATRTVHGSRRASVRALDDLALEVDNARSHAGTGVIAFTRALVVGPDGPVLGATKTDATHCTDLDAESAQVLRRCQCGCPATSGDSPCRCPVPLATLSQRLNHARISTTVNVYPHAIPAWDRPAAEKLAAILAGDNNEPEHARRS